MIQNIKTFNIRIPREIWLFLKKQSIETESSMNMLIVECLKKQMKKKAEKDLKDGGSMVL